MSAAACARAASDLTTLVIRLDRTRQALDRQSRLPEERFGGLSGDAYRRHAARSAVAVADAGSDLAVLAGALAALSRDLAEIEELRGQAAARAHQLEQEAQERWREAVGAYDGSVRAGSAAAVQPVVEGHVLRPASPPYPAEPRAAESVVAPADPVVPAAPTPEPDLESGFVTPPRLEAELVVPDPEEPRCGTPEVLG